MWLNDGAEALIAGAGGSGLRRPLRSAQSCKACNVRSRAVCGGLDEAALTAFASLGRHQSFRRGQTISWEGDDNLLCGNLLSGLVAIVASAEGGREQIVGLFRPGDFVGRIYADRAGFTLSVLTDSSLCLFPRTAFEHFMEDHPAMERTILRHMLEALDDARERMLMLARKSASERIAGFLVGMNESLAGPGKGGAVFDLPLTRGQIAEILGLTIETVSRQLTRLKGAGIIRFKGARQVEILDPAALAARAAG